MSGKKRLTQKRYTPSASPGEVIVSLHFEILVFALQYAIEFSEFIYPPVTNVSRQVLGFNSGQTKTQEQ
jgi:hypothetical protein